MINWSWPIFGHQKVVQFLQKSIEKDRLSHAYLFVGPENIGKKTVAKYFALSLICQSKEKKPCLNCLPCQEVLKNISPEVYWLRKEKDKKNIGIDQIRDLKTKLFLSPFSSSYKIAIIIDVEKLTREAADSFLKILEEPPVARVIILIANSLKFLPKTIISRCQLVRFSLTPKKIIEEFLNKKFHFSENKIKEITSYSLGRFGRAMKLVEFEGFLEKFQKNSKIFLEIIEADLDKKFKIIEKISQQEDKVLKEIIFCWTTVIRDFILMTIKNDFLIINSSLRDRLKKIISRYSLNQLYYTMEELNRLKIYLHHNVNTKLALENFVLTL